MPVRKILVVDDFVPWHKHVLMVVEAERDLTIVGHAANGLDGVKKARELQPDLVLMDISLPVMNGFEATLELRACFPQCKILFVSSFGDLEFVRRAFELGGCGFIAKVDATGELVSGIRAVLRGEQFVSRSAGTPGK